MTSLHLMAEIGAAVFSLQQSAQSKDIRIITTLDPAADKVNAEAVDLQRVLRGLLAYAVTITPNSKYINVSLGALEGYAKITITATCDRISTGSSAHHYGQMTPLYNMPALSHRELPVDLIQMRQLPELHGGSLEVNSDGIHGCGVFVIKLPLTLSPHESHSTQAIGQPTSTDRFDSTQSQSSFHEMRILVVDDDLNTREMLAEILAFHGAEVRLAGSATDARLVYASWLPHIVISDVGMPEEDGYDFIRSIRVLPTGSTTKAIALTGYSRLEDRQRALAAGYDHFVVKPVDLDELFAIISNIR
ncbi:MAG: response regulator [Burkholderiales bacterium]